jgi:hypothetical protein
MLHGRAILPACEAAVGMVADEGLAGLEIVGVEVIGPPGPQGNDRQQGEGVRVPEQLQRLGRSVEFDES